MTVPSGGTSDYASEMIHAAARGEPYACFVRPDSRIPFMAMPDAIEALLKLSRAAPNRLSCSAYNVKAFNPSADEIRASALRAFPDAKITYRVDAKRQSIIDSWPEDVDDMAARNDWDFSPSYDFDRAFHEYSDPHDQELAQMTRFSQNPEPVSQNQNHGTRSMIAIAITRPEA